MYVIGLTGGIASGKSTVSALLAQRGAVILSADLAGHELYRPGTRVWQQVVDAFGPEVMAADGSIDRKKLGSIVFADQQALKRLNAITHPPIKELMRQRLADLAGQRTEVAVLEAALLIEAGWTDLADEVWVTVVPPPVAVQRLIEGKGLSREEALARIASQLSNEERTERAGVVINTDYSLQETHRIVEEAWSRLLARLWPDCPAERSPSTSKSV